MRKEMQNHKTIWIKTPNSKLIKKIKIGKCFYKIFKCDKIIIKRNLKNNKEEYYKGYISYYKKEIFLNGERAEEVLLHEIMHSIFAEMYFLTKTNKRFFESLIHNEQLVNYLSILLRKSGIVKKRLLL